jgi:hypothetical protein
MKFATLFGAAAALNLSAAAVADDRPVTDEERAQIEAVLEAEGFIRWGEMEFDIDDDHFEVDDAIHEDGREYDLKLDVDFVIISRDLED